MAAMGPVVCPVSRAWRERRGPLSQEGAVVLKRMAEGTPWGDPALSDADLKAVLEYMRKAFQGAM